MKNFNEIIAFAKERGPKTISVACAQDKEVLLAVEAARKEGIAKAILVGDEVKIAEIAEQSLKNDLKAAEARKKLIDLEKELARAKNNTAAAQFGGASAQGAGVSGVIGAINTQKNDRRTHIELFLRSFYDIIKRATRL